MKSCYFPQNRRGLSSVVGALFFTVLMVAGFSVLSLALDAQTDIVTTQRMVTDVEIKKFQERFGIAVSTDANNHLDIAVTNLGQNPVEISSMWIINKTLSDAPAARYTIDYADSFVTGGSTTQILNSQILQMTPDTYDIKVVSSLGTIEIAELEVGPGGSSSNALRSVLVTDPPDVVLGQNVTIGMVVTNIGQLPIDDVTPSTISANPPAAVTASSTPNLASVDLIPGESFLFLWDYTIDGTADTQVDFSNFATGLDANNNFVQSNTASDTSVLREDESGDTSSTPTIVLTQDLLSRPEIFLTVPSPLGDGTSETHKALWGANIVNPTDQDMYVSKVVISLISPRTNNNDIMFRAGSGSDLCNPETVSPTPDNWSCPEHNQLVWTDTTNPVRIPPFSVFPFNALVNADRLAGSSDTLSSVIVHGNVYTTVGQFGKAGYGSSFDNGQTALANVYLSEVVDSVSKDDMISNKTGIVSGTSTSFNVVLADLEAGTSHKIDDTSRLIINIPKGWVVNEPSIDGHGDFTTSYQQFGDTSSQIIGDVSADLTNGGITISFDATAPTVTTEQMYVMYLLAEGSVDDNSFTMGPLQEAILQVVPP
ncbi:hypothetical protein [Nitrosopumilus sp.]|uniref:hypothetical protein n=1 Tax=Nitrosopumilus sp. TaxID=2024843 RepID=UPI0026062956|nr:hypothetical protein [Nitrosopumilus sp.]